jgi:hypothetical protein
MSIASQKQELAALEGRIGQLSSQLKGIELTAFINKQTLARRQEQLASVTDPEERAQLESQISGLTATIADENRRISGLTSQVNNIQLSISSLATSLLPGFSLASLTPSAASLDKLKSVVVNAPINAAQVLKQIPASVSIPGLDKTQITGLLSSATAVTSQLPTTVSATAGIGKYGLTPQQLEQQGFLKPGTTQTFLQGGGNIESVLNSASVWTGKNGMSSLTNFTSSVNIQSLTQQNLMSDGLKQLKSLGVVTGAESAEQLGSLVQSAGKFGASSVKSWAEGKAGPELTSAINNISKDAQQAINLVTSQLPTGGAIPVNIAGEIGTVDRSKLDSAFVGIIGSAKIPLPSFGGVSNLASFGSTFSFSNLQDQASALLARGQAQLNSVTSTNITNQIG